MRLHRKWDRLNALQPDLAIIPECAEPSLTWSRRKSRPECESQWVGDNPNKGLGVFAFSGLRLERHHLFNPNHKYLLPVAVSGSINFSLLAIWAFGRRTPGTTKRLGTPTAVLLEDYERLMAQGPVVVAGDFNNSVCWDKPGKRGNFANIASRLEEHGLTSAYHSFVGSPYGAEPHPTLFWLKGKGVHHIDYCFLPLSWSLTSVVVGNGEEWVPVSDHAPLIVECVPT